MKNMAKHLIRDFRILASTPFRRDALSILEAGLEAVDVRESIMRSVKVRGKVVAFQKKKINLSGFNRVFVFGIGKAAAEACGALEDLLGSRITGGIALDVKKVKLKRIKSIAGTHPFPSLANMRATDEIVAMLKKLEPRDLVIVVVSGGGSALLARPYRLTYGEVSAITKFLMSKGADIREMNIVRKHLSEIQGGQFARLAYPATVVGLVISDVIGNDLELIGSGPTVRDSSTVADAARILKKYNVFKACAMSICDLKETPKDKIFFKKVTNILVASNLDAVRAMTEEAKRLGWKPRVFSTRLSGESREVGKKLLREPKPGEAVIAAGETTVTLRGKGKGGRNQELALSALLAVDGNKLVISCASDGVDNSLAAGAIADIVSAEDALRAKLSAEKYLERNDSYSFFSRVNGQIRTGITGTNVSDLMIAMRKKE